MDFITNFPLASIPSTSQEANTVLVVVDRLSKIIHFIPLKFGNNNTFPKIITKLLFDHIFRLHGFLKEIILDRDTRFVSGITHRLYQLTGIKQAISTALYPEINGQSERIIQTFE